MIKQLVICLVVVVLGAGCQHARIPRFAEFPLVPSALPLQLAQAEGPAQLPVSQSADGRFLLTTDDQHAGLYLTDFETTSTTTISRGLNVGYGASLTPSGDFVLFKMFRPAGGAPERPLRAMPSADAAFDQAPVIYDVSMKRTLMLSEWSPVAGTPAMAADGTLAFTVGRVLIVVPAGRREEKRYPIGHAANLLSLSADGMLVLHATADETLAVLDRRTGLSRTVAAGDHSFTHGLFSPDDRHFTALTMNGKVLVGTTSSEDLTLLGDGDSAAWLSPTEIVWVADGGALMRKSLPLDPQKPVQAGRLGSRWWSLAGNRWATQQKDVLRFGSVKNGALAPDGEFAWVAPDDATPSPKEEWPDTMLQDGYGVQRDLVREPGAVRILGVPYVHQVYDTPDGFNGNWACGAVSSVMVLAFHGALEPSPIQVSTPALHRSRFGSYISQPYTVSQTAFTMASPDADGRPACGGYGYIVRDDWRDTKNYMADYLRIHGMESMVDWSPTMAKYRGEIGKMHPFVVLHSITLAGHYCTAVGFDPDRQVVIFHDPYGSKNTREYPSIDGRFARYDLPGYNNGYQNLRVVHCFIHGKPGRSEDRIIPAGAGTGNP